jgi:mono/diheme cytochrome c family protein
MKIRSFVIFAGLSLAIFACKSKQKTAANPTESVPANAPAPAVAIKPANGIYQPGTAELEAIQSQFKGTSEAELLEGYKLYTGACTSCHQPKNIYNRPEAKWPSIIGDMAMRAQMNQKQSDAILKFVLSVKAVQPK